MRTRKIATLKLRNWFHRPTISVGEQDDLQMERQLQHNAEIDAEHQQLFRLVNDFFEAVDDKVVCGERAVSLFQYTCEHFKHEETLMLDMGYPAMAEHVEQHHHLLDRIGDLLDRVSKDTLHASELKTSLAAWLVGHIVTFDITLFTYVNQHKIQLPVSRG